MVGTQVLGKLADRAGSRAIYILSITCFGIGSLLIVLAAGPTQLYLGRAVQGFGAGGIFTVAAAVIGMRLPVAQRGPALGILGTVWGLAFFLGPLLGGLLLRYSWHWLFAVNLPIAVLLIAGAWKLLPSAGSEKHRPFDIAGTVTLTAGLTALVAAMNQLDTGNLIASLTCFPVTALLAAVAILLPLFWFVELRAKDPILRPGLLASRQVLTACILAGGVGALQTSTLFYPALAVTAIGVSESTASLLLLPGVVDSSVMSLAVGYLLNHLGTRIIVLVSLVFSATSLLIYSHADLSIATFITAGLIGGIGSAGLIGAPLRWTILNESGPKERGSAQGLMSNFTAVGRLIGAAGLGAMAASRGGVEGYQVAFTGMAVFVGVLFLGALTLKSRAAEKLGTR